MAINAELQDRITQIRDFSYRDNDAKLVITMCRIMIRRILDAYADDADTDTDTDTDTDDAIKMMMSTSGSLDIALHYDRHGIYQLAVRKIRRNTTTILSW